MRVETIKLNKNTNKLNIHTKNKLNKNDKLNFFCLNPNEIKIKYTINSEHEFIIELQEPIKNESIVLYEVDRDYTKINENWRNNLFQTYKKKNNTILSLEKECKKMNKNINYKFFDDERIIEFIKTYYDEPILNFYNTIKQFPLKIDFWRLLILYIYGGWYMDIDTCPLIPFNEIIDKKVKFLAPITIETMSIFNAVLYSSPRNPIIMDCILMFLRYDMDKCVWRSGAFQSTYDMLVAIKKEIYETDSQKLIPHMLQNGYYNRGEVKLVSEVCCGSSVYDYYVLDFGKKIFKSRIDNYDWLSHKFIDENENLV